MQISLDENDKKFIKVSKNKKIQYDCSTIIFPYPVITTGLQTDFKEIEESTLQTEDVLNIINNKTM